MTHFTTSRQKILLTLLLLIPMLGSAQTTIDYDNAANWTAGSVALGSYANDHTYNADGWVFTGGNALRNSTALQDGFAGALGTYSWRLRDLATVDWRGTYQGTEAITQFGFTVRRWDATPSPAFDVTYSTDGGSTFSAAVHTINNTWLDNTSNWKVFSYSIPAPVAVAPGNFIVRVAATGTTERIMIDDFTFTTGGGGPSCGISLGTPEAVCNTITEGDADTYDLSIPYSGMESGVTVVNNSGSGTLGGDDPGSVADGTITISGISETDDFAISFTAPCEVLTVSGPAPDCDPIPVYDLVINEIFADPGTTTGDANGDGTVSSSQDEFVEIVNFGASDLDISGWTLSDAIGTRHTFPNGTVISAGCAIVVFGGGTPTGPFGGAIIQTASTSMLGLNNGGDDVLLHDPQLNIAASHTFGSEGGNDRSLTRSPDITGEFIAHDSAPGSGGTLYSPGTQLTGASFSGCAAPACNIVLGTPAAVCNSVTEGTSDTYELSIPYTGSQAGVTVINNSGSGTVGGDDPGTTADGTIIISGISETNAYDISFSAPCASLLLSGPAPNCDPIPPPPSLVINEVDYDQPSIDTEEFIELMNTGATPIDLEGISIILVNGSNGSEYSTVVLPAISLPAGGYYVVCYGNHAAAYCDLTVSGAVQNGNPDGIRLTTATNEVIDQMSYGGDMSTTEGSSAGTISGSFTGLGLSRIPDGNDTDDNSADFFATCITPGAANTFEDSDQDGVNDCLDLCPGGDEPGTACDDEDPNTTDDTIGSDCICAGVATDCEGVAGGPALPGTSCDDADPNTVGDVYQEDCTCAGQLVDCLGVPGGDASPGTACDDGDLNTTNDTWSEACICAGTPIGPCTNDLVMELQTDANGNQTSWEILSDGTLDVMCDGANYPGNSVITEDCCLPDGCYLLRVYDSAGDGMTTGGYILRTIDGDRIIDNRNNFSTGFESAIANDQGFCLPIGEDRLIYTSCDKLDWVSNQFIVASMNPAVSAEWNDGAPNHMQDANSGYQFWFFDPNGSYSFRRFRSHATSDGYPATGPARAAHLRINNWGASNHIPEGVLLNVRVRSRVNGVDSEWGPACRFMLEPVAAQCPTTKLMDIPGNQFLSCGQYREFEPGSYVHARPVSGATSYEFRFRLPAEGYEVIRTGSSYFVQLYWTVPPPLATGSQYEVDVRAFKGGQWCPWGEVCTLNIGTDPGMQGGSQNATMIGDVTTDATLNMWPNPNNGDQLFLSLSEVPEGVLTVNVDMFDLFGKRVMARQIAANDGFVNTVLDLQGELAAGMYMVNIIAGEKVYSQRLVVQP